MLIAIGLLTADRRFLTRKTLHSITTHADVYNCIRLHADDGSKTHDNFTLADEYGFKTVYRTGKRTGQIPAIKCLLANAIARGATHFLYLENDWRFTRRLRFSSIEHLIDGYDSVRLYGAYKRSIHPLQKAGEHIIGTKEKIRWTPLKVSGDWEATPQAHWGGPPSITEINLLHSAAQRSRKIGDLNRKLARISTARPVDNFVEHIGFNRTPDFTL